MQVDLLEWQIEEKGDTETTGRKMSQKDQSHIYTVSKGKIFQRE